MAYRMALAQGILEMGSASGSPVFPALGRWNPATLRRPSILPRRRWSRLPAVRWLLGQGSMGWAIFMGARGLLVVSSVDNFLKPYLISRGSSLPFVLVFLGAVGGILAFGFIGIFLGPTLLAIGYSLLNEWSASAVATGTPPLSSEADDARQIGEIGASSGQRVLVQSREKPAKY